jgi:pimeloyl-ACP methyl ester carboxylesterase
MRLVLVHGGAHGAWCWDQLIPELRKTGNDAVAMDLPGHGERKSETATLNGYRQAVVDVLSPGDVLVGHSMGCAVATMAADHFIDVRHIVYLAGPLPVEGKPMAYDGGVVEKEDGTVELFGREKDSKVDKNHRFSADLQTLSYDLEGAREAFYQDCTTPTVLWAFERLTPQRVDVMVSEPIVLDQFWEADLPRSYIRCTNDQAFPRPVSARSIKRLGVEELTIESSHSPFLSRPRELAELLVRAVETKPIGPLIPTSL